jgi:hypothetical protein
MMPTMRIRYVSWAGTAAQKQIASARRNISERKTAEKKTIRLRN